MNPQLIDYVFCAGIVTLMLLSYFLLLMSISDNDDDEN